ncbi:leucine-rich repeat-containing protein 71 [Eudromia elegans]
MVTGERAAREKAAAARLAAAEEEEEAAARKAEQGAGEHQCSGLLELDLAELCARAGLQPPGGARGLEGRLARIHSKYSYFQPRVQVEPEAEEPRGVREVFLRGWRLEETMLGILGKCLPALGSLQAVHLWRVGLTELLLPSLLALLASCPGLRTLSLEDNPLPEDSFHKLMGPESTLAHLSLRHNGIGDEGARLIGQSLSTAASANRSLVSLGLAFNRISDAGAGYIADGLRFNRSLLSLSLSHNAVGDAGALRLAEVLAPFALTHAEVVERRWLLLKEASGQPHAEPGPRRSPLPSAADPAQQKHDGGRSERPCGLGGTAQDKGPAAKQNKGAAKKKVRPRRGGEQAGEPPAPAEPKAARAKGAKGGGKEKRSPMLDMEAPAEELHPLLEEAEHRDGKVFVPGNRELLNLNLAYNRVTERGLHAFVALMQGEPQRREGPAAARAKPRPLRVALQGNLFPASCPAFAQLQELLRLRDPLRRHKGEEQGPGA